MKLIKMTDFVIKQEKEIYRTDNTIVSNGFITNVHRYALFLNQPLTLGMFAPCDEEGEVLDFPNEKNEQFYGAYGISNLNKAKNKYQAAKERVLFEGWLIEEKDHYSLLSDNNGYSMAFTSPEKGRGSYQLWKYFWGKKTVEMLISEYNDLTLTKSAIKQLGL